MDQTKEPHALSLKVLRLSRPQLATQDPLPEDPSISLSHMAALALPSASIDDVFTLTPLLTLPTTFGTAYVGESFSAILSINNELPTVSDRRIVSVKVAAEMQTPSSTRSLDMNSSPAESREQDESNEKNEPGTTSLKHAVDHGLASAESMQSILTFDLREEGVHVLLVTITYTESVLARTKGAEQSGGDSQAGATPIVTGGRVRVLRKLYNFAVGPCLSVRTKATALPASTTALKSGAETSADPGSGELASSEQFLLECQMENLAHDTITIERLVFEARSPFSSTSLNWDAEHVEVPVLAPREVTQVAFWIGEASSSDKGAKSDILEKKEISKDGRTVLGVLTIHWRSAMGSLGVLSTGWLSSRPRRL